MKLLSITTKVIGIITFLLSLFIIFGLGENTPRLDLFHYSFLLGWNNEDKLVTESIKALNQTGAFIFLCIVIIRFIHLLITFSISNDNVLAKDISHTIGTYADMLCIYIIVNLLSSASIDPDAIIYPLLGIILGLTYIIWKIGEMAVTMSEDDDGALNFRESLRKYLNSYSHYSNYISDLKRNYKNILNETN
jgi:hypothetical protein